MMRHSKIIAPSFWLPSPSASARFKVCSGEQMLPKKTSIALRNLVLLTKDPETSYLNCEMLSVLFLRQFVNCYFLFFSFSSSFLGGASPQGLQNLDSPTKH